MNEELFQFRDGPLGTAIEEKPLPHQHHSDTSRVAAEAFKPKAGTARAVVLAYLRAQGEDGATDKEMQEALGMPGSTQRPRRIELVSAGIVGPCGKQRNGSTVWVAV